LTELQVGIRTTTGTTPDQFLIRLPEKMYHKEAFTLFISVLN